MRTYTVSQHRAPQNEIDVDFMMHTAADGTASGVAASWASQVQLGDPMFIFGPGPATMINFDAQWFF